MTLIIYQLNHTLFAYCYNINNSNNCNTNNNNINNENNSIQWIRECFYLLSRKHCWAIIIIPTRQSFCSTIDAADDIAFLWEGKNLFSILVVLQICQSWCHKTIVTAPEMQEERMGFQLLFMLQSILWSDATTSWSQHQNYERERSSTGLY